MDASKCRRSHKYVARPVSNERLPMISPTVSQHLAMSVSDMNILNRAERLPQPRYLDPEHGRPKRKSSQIELTGISIKREMITRTEADIEEEEVRMSKTAAFTRGKGRRNSSMSEDDLEKPRRLSDTFEQGSRHDVVFDVTR